MVELSLHLEPSARRAGEQFNRTPESCLEVKFGIVSPVFSGFQEKHGCLWLKGALLALIVSAKLQQLQTVCSVTPSALSSLDPTSLRASLVLSGSYCPQSPCLQVKARPKGAFVCHIHTR